MKLLEVKDMNESTVHINLDNICAVRQLSSNLVSVELSGSSSVVIRGELNEVLKQISDKNKK